MSSLTRKQIEDMCELAIGVNRLWSREKAETLRDMALRALPAGEVVAAMKLCDECDQSSDCLHFSRCFRVLAKSAGTAPAPVAAEPSGNPLLWNVHCMYQQAERDMGWHGQWRDLLAAIEQHLQRVGYPNPAPADESPVDSHSSAADARIVKYLLDQAAHIEDNASKLKTFAGSEDEARCRELCASYLRELAALVIMESEQIGWGAKPAAAPISQKGTAK